MNVVRYMSGAILVAMLMLPGEAMAFHRHHAKRAAVLAPTQPVRGHRHHHHRCVRKYRVVSQPCVAPVYRCVPCCR